ncbi:3-oxoacyl-acyl-carrier protein reductase [Salinisphaera shabanensis E1L3A]|uniref:3-oxoacyl-acyl-carrier protein reductase n=1 Tax=Salinisphaera shabanensis E1L3A TaxID=1033802 RepID=U2EMC1_9GAMM|nr:SDR family oxidoreductase [Salinisphaera shabanensis]ERJ19332.1 3-oxoacyl-acyl-carrier protein reductase [Salinisphaera shabanensis E1L3A]
MSYEHETSDTRVALVTGAARGIGRAVTRRLLAEGFHVGALDNDANALTDLHQELGKPSPSAARRLETFATDVTDEPSVEDAVKALADMHGRLDVLVNNAGIADPFNGPIESLALEDWNRVIGVNLTGYFLCTKHCTPWLRRSAGAIVNMASSRAYQSEAQTEAYAASKGGIVALTHALSISLGPEIRVNAVAPGWIDVRNEQPETDSPGALRAVDHEQHPGGRVGRGDDIAAVVAFLCGSESTFITGQTLIADGGMTRKMIYTH